MNPATSTTRTLTSQNSDQMECAIIVDNRLRIINIQPITQPFINVLLTDIGRSITHFTINFLDYTSLDFEQDIQRVLQTGNSIEKKILNKNKVNYLLAIDLSKKGKLVTGATITFKQIPVSITNSNIFKYQPVVNGRSFLEVLVHSLPNYIFYLSKEGKYLEYIPPKDAPTQIDSKDYIGKKISDIYPTPMASQIMRRLQVALQTGITQEFEYQAEWDEQRTFMCNMVKVDDKHVLCISQDCTEQKIAEKAVLQSEYVYRKIATLFPDGLTIVFNKKREVILYEGQLRDHFIDDVNAIIGCKPCQVTKDHKDFWQHFTDLYGSVIEGKTFHFEASYRSFTLLFQLVPLKNDQGEIFGGLCLVQDITKIKQKELKLQEQVKEITQTNQKLRRYIASNSELESFAYVASHDLKQPLRNIVSFAQLLNMRAKDTLNEEGKEYIQYIMDNARSMNHFIEALMNYSRVSASASVSENSIFETVVLEEVIYIIRQNLAQQLRENNVHLVTKNLPTFITGIKVKLTQLLQNLISNAIKFKDGSRSPFLEITAIETPTHWQFAVADNGIGIAPEYINKVFYLFKRLHTKSEYEGSGIGLATCKKIVQQHHGDIWVESVVGKGSIFYFTIKKIIQV